jgi:hypothetical protein
VLGYNGASGNESGDADGVLGLGYVGVEGQNTAEGGVALYGFNGGVDTTDYTDEAVLGVGLKYGVVGQSLAASGYGLYSETNAYVTKQLKVAGSKAFHIDHPLDPANKFLNHYCAESNEVLNFYRGNVNLDANGTAVVTLPDYFSSINTNYSYILTPVGDAAPNLHISKEISGNAFSIAGGPAGLKVSWQVTAVRSDPYLQAHPEMRVVEEEKSPSEKGKYLSPETYGLSADMAIYKARPIQQSLKAIGLAKRIPVPAKPKPAVAATAKTASEQK